MTFVANAAAPRRSMFRALKNQFALPLLFAASLGLAACGGGGGDDPPPPPAPPPVPPAATAPSALSYTSPQTYVVGSAITPLAPTVTGTVTSYTVTPNLPAGLALNATTGEITGTPTTASPAAVHTITASNTAGSTTFDLSIAVDAIAVGAPSGLTYVSPQTYAPGAAITPLDATVTGTVDTYSVAPALPAGLAIDAVTGQISGTPTAPAALATYTVTAANAAGSATFGLDIAVLYERVSADRPDEVTGPQVHVLYVIPEDGADQQLDQLGSIEGSARSWNEWFATQSGGSLLRLDTFGGGRLDVTFVQLSRTDAQMSPGNATRDRLEYLLLAAGFNSTEKVYLVYYGGEGDGCGRGAWPPSRPGNVGAVFLGSPGCAPVAFSPADQPPGYWDLLAVHEVLHVLGFVPTCAPNHDNDGHVNDDPTDVLASGGDTRNILDVNKDDYFQSAVPGCIALQNSAYLEPEPAGAEAPPGWPYANLADLGCAAEATVPLDPPGAATQLLIVNDYAPGGSPSPLEIFELDPARTRVPAAPPTANFADGAIVTASANDVFVVTAGGTCVGLVRAAPAFGRFVISVR